MFLWNRCVAWHCICSGQKMLCQFSFNLTVFVHLVGNASHTFIQVAQKNLWGTYYSLYKCVGPVNNPQCMHALHFLFPCASRNGTSTCSLCRSSFMVLRPMWSRPPPGSNPQRSNYKPGPPTTALPGHCTSSQWDLSMYEVSSSYLQYF